MKTKFEDVAHLYLGCPIWICKNIEGNDVIETLTANMLAEDELLSEYKPILRPLSDMTEEEQRHSYLLAGWEPEYSYEMLEEPDRKEETNLIALIGRPNVWNYLLSKHFDLFGLIESGQAIDKTTLK